MFDNGDYPEDSPFHFKDSNKVIGKMKDEAAGCPITEFVGKRITMYSYIKDYNEGGVRTDKGVKKSVIKKVIRHDNYRGVLFNSRKLHHNMKGIRSVNHQLHSYQINKLSPSCPLSCVSMGPYLKSKGCCFFIGLFVCTREDDASGGFHFSLELLFRFGVP